MLNQLQIDFLCEIFFEHREIPGWKSIAESLLLDEKAVVAGKENIWESTEIAKFIQTEPAVGYVDCTLYKFDKKEFFKSELFLDKKNQILVNLNNNISELLKKQKTIILIG